MMSRWSGLLAAFALVIAATAAMALEDKYFDSAGVNIRYVEQGAGEPVILVQGFSGNIEGWIAYAQNSRAPEQRVPEPEARVPGQPTVGPLQSIDRRTETTGQAPIRVPGAGNPYGAQGGAIPGVPNPDRVPGDTPGGQDKPPI